RLGGNVGPGARPVLNDDGLAQPFLQPLTDQAPDDIGSSAGGKAYEEAHRTRRISLCPRHARQRRQHCSTRSQTQKLAAEQAHGERAVALRTHARAFRSPDTLSRPHRAVIAKRNRGPRPVRRGFGQLHGWLEVAEPAGWRLTDRRPTFQFAGDELGWYTLKRRGRHFAEINDPLADLSKRDPYQPAATFPRPACQCHHRAKRHQVTPPL